MSWSRKHRSGLYHRGAIAWSCLDLPRPSQKPTHSPILFYPPNYFLSDWLKERKNQEILDSIRYPWFWADPERGRFAEVKAEKAVRYMPFLYSTGLSYCTRIFVKNHLVNNRSRQLATYGVDYRNWPTGHWVDLHQAHLLANELTGWPGPIIGGWANRTNII